MKGYRRFLRLAALPVTDRKWAAPLSAIALGFGLFLGVAIGPGAAGTLATGAMQIIEIPVGGGSDEGEVTAEAPPAADEGRPAPAPAPGSPDSKGFASEPLAPLLPSEPEFAVPDEEAAPAEPEAEPPPVSEEPEPEEEKAEGLVVHVNEAAGSYVVAERGGAFAAVHAATMPRPGAKVEVPIHLLANGTYAEAGKRVKAGTGTRASLSGIVTYVDSTPSAPAYTVSKRGASMLVRVKPDPAGAPPVLPALGAFVTVAVDVNKADPSTEPPVEAPVAPVAPGCAPDPEQPPLEPAGSSVVLWQRRLEDDGDPLTYADFGGIVVAVCPEAGELLLSADDAGESGETLLFKVSEDEEIDLTRLEVGRSALATATISSAGELELTGFADDERRKGAGDKGALQGDFAP